MTIASETLVTRVRNELEDEPWSDYLTGAYTAASGVITVNQPTQWAEGDMMELDDASGNLLRVSATPTVNPVTVKAGRHQTTDANASSGAVVLKNPAFEHDEILTAIKRVIDGLWPWVWKKRTTTLTFVATKRLYAVPTDFLDLISLVQDTTPSGVNYQTLRYGRDTGYPIAVQRDVPTAIAASNIALWVPSFRLTPVATATLSYASQVSSTPAAGSFADVDDGLMSEMIVLGTCQRLVQNTEMHRTQDDVRQGDIGVASGQRLRSASWYKQEFQQARHQYNLRLLRESPIAGEWAR